MRIQDLNKGDKFKFKNNPTNVYTLGESTGKGFYYYNKDGVRYKTGTKDIISKNGSKKLIDKKVIKVI